MTATRLDFTKPHLLRNEAEYEAALAEAERLMHTKPRKGTDADERIEFLLLLIKTYEDKHYPMDEAVTPQEVVEFMLEQQNMDRADLAELLGGRSRVSEFFSGKRPLFDGADSAAPQPIWYISRPAHR